MCRRNSARGMSFSQRAKNKSTFPQYPERSRGWTAKPTHPSNWIENTKENIEIPDRKREKEWIKKEEEYQMRKSFRRGRTVGRMVDPFHPSGGPSSGTGIILEQPARFLPGSSACRRLSFASYYASTGHHYPIIDCYVSNPSFRYRVSNKRVKHSAAPAAAYTMAEWRQNGASCWHYTRSTYDCVASVFATCASKNNKSKF